MIEVVRLTKKKPHISLKQFFVILKLGLFDGTVRYTWVTDITQCDVGGSISCDCL